MDKFCVFVYMLMRDASLKQRMLCIICTSFFGPFSAGKNCALYTDKYGVYIYTYIYTPVYKNIAISEINIIYVYNC